MLLGKQQPPCRPRLNINNSAGDWLLPPRCRNILFPRCVPWVGRRRRKRSGSRGGMLSLINADPPSAAWHSTQLEHHHGNALYNALFSSCQFCKNLPFNCVCACARAAVCRLHKSMDEPRHITHILLKKNLSQEVCVNRGVRDGSATIFLLPI